MIAIPERLYRNNAQARGTEGVTWLRQLPGIIADMRDRWTLQIGEPFPRLSFNYAAPALRADGTHAVLKLCPPGDEEFSSEANALRLYNGQGMSRLLEVDLERGAMLLEHLEPGTPLHTLRDESLEISIAVGIMQRLWRAPLREAHTFPTVASWGLAFERHRAEHDGGSGPLPRSLFERGETLYRELDASATHTVLLHGDLHHENILAAQREPWLAIDPKGLAGDPGFEVGTYLNNLWPELYVVPDAARTLRRRVDQFSEELGIERARVSDWGVAFCVLSAVWSAENNGEGWQEAIGHAELLDGLRD